MIASNVCPGPEDLLKLTQALLSNEELEQLCRHLEQCQHCLDAVTAQADDPLTSALRQARPVDLESADSPVMKDLVSRLKRLAPPIDNETQTYGDPQLSAAKVVLGLIDAELLDRVGRGGMGEVFRGKDPALGRNLAVKVLRPELHGDAGAEGRFQQ